MANYRLTPTAEHGLREILIYADREFGSDIASEVLERLVCAFENVAANPEIGHLRQDLTVNPNIRFWSVPPSLIAYRIRENSIEILFVERGEKDWQRLLTE